MTAVEMQRKLAEQLRDADIMGASDVGAGPYRPMLVVYLGAGAAGADKVLRGRLEQQWPSHKQDLLFVRAENGVYTDPKSGEEFGKERLYDKVVSLFDEKKHFEDRSYLLVYYLLNTEDLRSEEELDGLLQQIAEIQSLCARHIVQPRGLAVLMFNMTLDSGKTAYSGVLKQLRGSQSLPALPEMPICLLSKTNTDNITYSDWTVLYNLCAAMVLISNNGNQHVFDKVFKPGLYYAGYIRQEKPYDDIAGICVKRMLESLPEPVTLMKGGMPDLEEVRRRLEISPDGTVGVLNRHIRQQTANELPDKEQLSLFPTRDLYDSEWDRSGLSAREFNEITLGAWKAFLDVLQSNTVQRLQKNRNLLNTLQDALSGVLRENFRVWELLSLDDASISRLLPDPAPPSDTEPVLEYVGRYLQYLIASDETARKIIIEEIQKAKMEARKLTDEWNGIYSSRAEIFTPQDEGLLGFYGKKLESYFTQARHRMEEDFHKRKTREALEKFLSGEMDTLRGSKEFRGIFDASYEQELGLRLSALKSGKDAKDAKDQIADNLKNAPKYLSTWNVHSALISYVLIKTDSNSADSLFNHLQELLLGWDVYNTGMGSAVEGLCIYQITDTRVSLGSAEEEGEGGDNEI